MLTCIRTGNVLYVIGIGIAIFNSWKLCQHQHKHTSTQSPMLLLFCCFNYKLSIINCIRMRINFYRNSCYQMIMEYTCKSVPYYYHYALSQTKWAEIYRQYVFECVRACVWAHSVIHSCEEKPPIIQITLYIFVVRFVYHHWTNYLYPLTKAPTSL